jgi:hypothetical protein
MPMPMRRVVPKVDKSVDKKAWSKPEMTEMTLADQAIKVLMETRRDG